MDSEVAGSANCLPPGVQVGEYRLMGVVGEGGFGIVYRARDLSLDRVVAIKEYMPSTLAGRMSSNQIHVRSQHRGAFDAGLRSFINEARLLAKFSHPALVHVYRFFEDNGTAYMVMRHYEGQTLRTFLEKQQSAVNQRWLAAMLSPVLDVVEMLHAADCFHRDIAPDNVFLQETGVPVLLDFGAARRIIGDMTQALTMVLKPGFAPIEQYVDDGAMPQGAWTDIYQIGAMLYLAITGKTPPTSVARMISDPMPLLTPDLYPGYSAQFLHGVHRALSVKPQDRPQSIAELKNLLGIGSFTSPMHSSPWASSASMPLMPEMLPQHSAFSPPAAPPATQPPPAPQRPSTIQPVTTAGRAHVAAELANAGLNPFNPPAPAPTPAPQASHQEFAPTQIIAPPAPAANSAAPSAAAHDGSSLTNRVREDLSLFAPASPAVKPADEAPKEAWQQPAPNRATTYEQFQETQQLDLPVSKPAAPSVADKPASPPPTQGRPAKPGIQAEPPVAATDSAAARRWGMVAAAVTVVLLVVVLVWWNSGGPAETVPPPEAALDAEEQEWRNAVDAGTVQALETYLKAHPDSPRTGEAQALISRLQAAASAAATPQAEATAAGVASAPASAALPSPSVPAVVTTPPPIAPTPAPPTTATTPPAGQVPGQKPGPAPGTPGAPTQSTPMTTTTPPVKPTETTPPTGTTPGKPATRPEAVSQGRVILRVMPWGNVSVNYSPVGTTPPLTQLDLPEGSHRIEVSNPAGAPVVRVVQVKKGEPVVFSHQFE